MDTWLSLATDTIYCCYHYFLTCEIRRLQWISRSKYRLKWDLNTQKKKPPVQVPLALVNSCRALAKIGDVATIRAVELIVCIGAGQPAPYLLVHLFECLYPFISCVALLGTYNFPRPFNTLSKPYFPCMIYPTAHLTLWLCRAQCLHCQVHLSCTWKSIHVPGKASFTQCLRHPTLPSPPTKTTLPSSTSLTYYPPPKPLASAPTQRTPPHPNPQKLLGLQNHKPAK